MLLILIDPDCVPSTRYSRIQFVLHKVLHDSSVNEATA